MRGMYFVLQSSCTFQGHQLIHLQYSQCDGNQPADSQSRTATTFALSSSITIFRGKKSLCVKTNGCWVAFYLQCPGFEGRRGVANVGVGGSCVPRHGMAQWWHLHGGGSNVYDLLSQSRYFGVHLVEAKREAEICILQLFSNDTLLLI